jgi:hypothetical protein
LRHAHKELKFNAGEGSSGLLVEHLKSPHGFISQNERHTEHGPGFEAGQPIKLVTESLLFTHILDHQRFAGLHHIASDAFAEVESNLLHQVLFFSPSDTDEQLIFLLIEFVHRARLCADEFLRTLHRSIKDVFYIERGDDEGTEPENSRQFSAVDIFGGLLCQVGTTLVC